MAVVSKSGPIRDDENSQIRELLADALKGELSALTGLVALLDDVSVDDFQETVYRYCSDRGNREAAFNLGLLLEARGDLSGARESMERAASLSEPQAPLWLGYHCESAGDLAAALDWYLRSEDFDQMPQAAARVLRDLGRDQEADDLMAEYAEKNAHAAVEWVLQEPDAPAARQIEVLQRHRDRGEVDVLIPLAELLESEGRVEEALTVLRESVASGEPNAPFNLGVTLFDHGDANGRREGMNLIKIAAQSGDDHALQWIVDHGSGATH